jgi:hypothetical protein
MDFDSIYFKILNQIKVKQKGMFEFEKTHLLDEGVSKEEVADSLYKYKLPGIKNDGAILMISNLKYPDMVSNIITKMTFIEKHVTKDTQKFIIQPITAGDVDGISYVLWPMYYPISKLFVTRKVQQIQIHSNVFNFINQLALDTKKEVKDKDLIVNEIVPALFSMAKNKDLSNELRGVAECAIKEAKSQDWVPLTVVQHSDLWLDNVLLKKSTRKLDRDIIIIDWGGAILNGSTTFDFVRYCLSTYLTKRRVKKELQRYSEITNLTFEELLFQLVLALGFIRQNLGEFPLDRFNAMSQKCFTYLSEIIELK